MSCCRVSGVLVGAIKTLIQAGAELYQAQAQLGYHAETTTKKDLHLKS